MMHDPCRAEIKVIHEKDTPRMLKQIHRDRYHIVYEILQLFSNNGSINKGYQLSLRYAAHLTHKQAVRYISEMIEEGLLILVKPPYPWYKITPKGWSYLRTFAEIRDSLRPINGTNNIMVHEVREASNRIRISSSSDARQI
jgi:predicted transcriptional regulator